MHTGVMTAGCHKRISIWQSLHLAKHNVAKHNETCANIQAAVVALWRRQPPTTAPWKAALLTAGLLVVLLMPYSSINVVS
jgi:hypothetical protein